MRPILSQRSLAALNKSCCLSSHSLSLPSITIVRRAFQTWKMWRLLTFRKENLSSQGISLSTTLICPGSVKPLCNDVTISHLWIILTSTSGDVNALKICAVFVAPCLSYDTSSASVRFFPWMTSLKTSPNFPEFSRSARIFASIKWIFFVLFLHSRGVHVCNQSLTQLSSPSSRHSSDI